MVTSDSRREVEIWPYRACAMKNMQYNPCYRNSSVIVDLAMGQITFWTYVANITCIFLEI